MRAVDNTDRWLVSVDPATGKTKVLDAAHDDAWVRDIGPSTNVSGGLGWLPDNRRVWYLAEHDGWMHLYTVDATADQPARKQLTTGRFEIDSVELSPDGATFYLQSNEQHPGERHLYALSVSGGTAHQIDDDDRRLERRRFHRTTRRSDGVLVGERGRPRCSSCRTRPAPKRGR